MGAYELFSIKDRTDASLTRVTSRVCARVTGSERASEPHNGLNLRVKMINALVKLKSINNIIYTFTVFFEQKDLLGPLEYDHILWWTGQQPQRSSEPFCLI